ncbi:MAG: hypothetical protein KF856_13965 [Cyclobacteriaceae bacterium]|nr:hypothetical protein [Cyclobacteriaceae bacterium]
MKVGLLILLTLLVDPGKIGQINTLKSQAKEAYLKGDFKTAITKYRTLIDSLGVTEDEVKLNLANAYFEAKDTANTAMSYQPLTQSQNSKIRSVAHQQLGVLSNRENKHEEALASFKQALKADPTNEDARYNYELVKKKLEQKKKEEEQKKNDPNQKEENKDKQDQNKDQKQEQKDKQDQQEKQDKKDQQNKEQQDKQKQDEQKKQEEQQSDEKKEQDKKETPQSVKDKLKEMEMSEEKAQMILEAMKNQEIQYLQQNKRKATKPKDRNKPDW